MAKFIKVTHTTLSSGTTNYLLNTAHIVRLRETVKPGKVVVMMIDSGELWIEESMETVWNLLQQAGEV